jgi:hypothetical protein
VKLTPGDVANYLLNKGPHTTAEIQAHFATSQTWTSRCIALAKAARLIYISSWRPPVRRGMPKAVFAVRTSAEQVDAVRTRKRRATVVQGQAPIVRKSQGIDPRHVEQAAGQGLWGALGR